MSDEKEDGELNSDVEAHDGQIETKLDEDIDCIDFKDSNPYDEEDLKIKALQSLLDTQPDITSKADNSEPATSSKKSSKNNPKKKLINSFKSTRSVGQIQKKKPPWQHMLPFDTDMRFNNHNMYENPMIFQRRKKISKRIKKKSRFLANQRQRQHQPINQSSTFSLQDNYEVQDMDIEPLPTTSINTSNTIQSGIFQQISPLTCRTNFNNEFTNSAPLSLPIFNTYFLNCQNQRHLYPSVSPNFFYSPTEASSAELQTTSYTQPLLDMPLTLEQQQNELNEMIEAKYQAEQHKYRKLPSQAFQNTSSLRNISFDSDQVKALIEIDLTNEESDEKLDKPPVIFTLSSGTSSGSSSVKSVSPVATTSSMFKHDIDYRASMDLLKSGSLVVPDNTDPFEKEKAMKADLMRKLFSKKSSHPVAVQEDLVEKAETSDLEAEREMQQLRLKLLANLNQKRHEQAQQNKEKQMAMDMSLMKKKLQEHELMIIKPLEQPPDQVQNRQRKITPVIIPLSGGMLVSDDDDDDEYVDAEPMSVADKPHQELTVHKELSSTSNLQDNISQFLKEAKNQAERIVLHSLLPNNGPSNHSPKRKVSTPPAAEPQNYASIKKTKSTDFNYTEAQKKSLVNSLRDKINMETRQISLLQQHAIDLKLTEAKKLKDIESTQVKLKLLREQIQAAEKVLKANQQSAVFVRQQVVQVGTKLSGMQNSKKLNQKLLQKVLLTPNSASVAVTLLANSPPVQKKEAILDKPPIMSKEPLITSVSLPHPPLPLDSPQNILSGPPVPQQPVQTPFQPPLPPLEAPPLPPPPEAPFMSQPKPPIPSQPKSLPIPESSSPLNTKPQPTPSQSLAKTTLNFKLPPMTLGGVVASTAAKSSSKSAYSLSNIRKNKTAGTALAKNLTGSVNVSTTRPNLFISKKTDQKLEALAMIDAQATNVPFVPKKKVTIQMVNGSKSLVNLNGKIKSQKAIETVDRQRFIDCLEAFVKQSGSHCESLDLWAYEAISGSFKESKTFFKVNPVEVCANVTSLNSCDFFNVQTAFRMNDTFDTSKPYEIEDVLSYESPLKVFKGYRFSSSFAKTTDVTEAYSKYYCNSIDFRRPFCPYDMHGSCKDSQCLYQHFNVTTMDNMQRTEHLFSYCPQEVLGQSLSGLTNKEALKKLKLYAKQFMNTHLPRMSIKDYFNYLYEQVVKKIKLEPSNSTLLSRAPLLYLNHSKSIGLFDVVSNEPAFKAEKLDLLLDTIISTNITRSLDIELKSNISNGCLNLDWLRSVECQQLNSGEILLTWIYYARQVYTDSSPGSIQKLLNILSNALETNPQCELIWLVYLRVYLSQKNAMNDYHEICLLSFDNMVTYDLVWFILNTCSDQHIPILIELYEKNLLELTTVEKIEEFEQSQNATLQTVTAKVSFYLMELIFFSVNFKLINSTANDAKELLSKYLHRNEIVAKLEPTDLCLVWLCAIHLEAFSCLPNMIRTGVILNSRVVKSFSTRSFWKVDKTQRSFNLTFFQKLNNIYRAIEDSQLSKGQNQRQTDLFLLPWNQNYSCPIEKLQGLFYEAMKSINNRLATLGTSGSVKKLTRLISVPLFINLITLEISNKRHEVAGKLCDRLLKSSEAQDLRELWISQIYIYSSQNSENSNVLVENTIKSVLKIFPMDLQITFVASQYYASIGRKNRSIDLIEILIESYFFDDDAQGDNKFEISTLFKSLLNLSNEKEPHAYHSQSRIDPDLSAEIKPLTKFENTIKTHLLPLSICYCFYMELKGADQFPHTLICNTYTHLIKMFKEQSSHAILWTRYFKYLSTQDSVDLASTLTIIRQCIQSLNQLSSEKSRKTTDFFIPFFHYLPANEFSSFSNQTCYDNNFFKTGHLTDDSYYTSNTDFNDEENFKQPGEGLTKQESTHDYYYYNCLVDLWLRLYTRNQAERCQLAKCLMDLMPHNLHVIRLFVNSGSKWQGIKATLQTLFDHLVQHAISNEQIWILCVKLCVDLKDWPQAVLMLQKSEAMCGSGQTSSTCLKRLTELMLSVKASSRQ